MSEHDGGSAFPGAEWSSIGMSLRDYFAGQVLAAAAKEWFSRPALASPEDVAVDCYRLADEMIAQRAKGPGGPRRKT